MGDRLLVFLMVIVAGIQSIEDDWRDISYDTTIEFDLQAYPLKIKTQIPFEDGSSDKIYVKFWDSMPVPTGFIQVKFGDPPSWTISPCTLTWDYIDVDLPAGTDNEWTFTKDSEENTLKIKCNEVEMIVFNYATDAAEIYTETCLATWSDDVAYISFSADDDASVEYRHQPVLCGSGSGKDGDGVCVECLAGEYSAGGATESCTACPDGKTSYAAMAGSAEDCTWVPCGSGQILDNTNGCLDCPAGEYSAGGTEESCTACPQGQTSVEGQASSAEDCVSNDDSASDDSDMTCNPGTYKREDGSCALCPWKSIAPETNQNSCQYCEDWQEASDDKTMCLDASSSSAVSVATGCSILLVSLLPSFL